jgi:hypothetical protein
VNFRRVEGGFPRATLGGDVAYGTLLVKVIAALVALLAVAGAAISVSGPESGTNSGDFETRDLSQWGERQCLPERVSLGSRRPAPVDGRYRARFEVRDGDVEPETGSERCELVGPSLPDEEERWYRQAIYVPSATDPPNSWQIISQWYSNYGGSPPLALFEHKGSPMRWSLRHGDSSRFYWRSRNLARDRWHEIVVGVFLSQGPSRGWVEVWLDGKQQTLENGKTRMYGQTRGTTLGAFKTGIYRDPDSTGTSIHYLDDFSAGSDRESVMPD